MLAAASASLPSDHRDPSALAIAYYPSRSELALRLDLRAAIGAQPASKGVVRVVGDRDSEVARVVLGGDERSAVVDLPDLPEGSYRVQLDAESATGATRRFEEKFERRRFPWEGNEIGLERRVLAPFQPLRVSGRDVDLVLRRYVLNDLGLWDGVTAGGRPLLARPIAIRFETARGAGTWRTKSAAFVRTDPDRVVFAAENDGGAVTLRTRSTIDFDGCMRVELELAPGTDPAELRALSIDIPLRANETPLWHLVRAGDTFHNLAGAAPAGTALVWESRRAESGAMTNGFFPYVWLGGEERGLAFFADNDRGWVGGAEGSALELWRDADSLTLRLRIVRTPIRVDRPMRVVFGLQASPTKPMPADWRSRAYVPYMAVNGAYWGMVSTYADKYPAERDYSIADAFVETRRTGAIDRAFIERWMAEKYVGAEPPLIASRRGLIESGFGWLSLIRDRAQVIYFEGSTQNLRSEEWETFQDEWAPFPFRERQAARRIRTAVEAEEYQYQVNRGHSYQDFAIWYAREWMRRGFGLMVDNMFLGGCYDTTTCAAYRLPDGRIQPSAEIWALRDYLRRMWTLARSLASESPFPLLVMAHMTNCLLLPVETFADITMDHEWLEPLGVGRFPQSPELIRTEMLGRQVGAYPHALHPLVGYPAWVASHRDRPDPVVGTRLERTEWGMRMVHEIIRSPSVFDAMRQPDWPNPDRTLEALVRGFGYGSADVRVLSYWEEPPAGVPAPSFADAEIKWLGLWKSATRELMVVAVNWVGRDVVGHLRVHPTVRSFRDAENGRPVDASRLTLSAGEVRVLVGVAD